jgi:hypothetical protein
MGNQKVIVIIFRNIKTNSQKELGMEHQKKSQNETELES